MKKTTTIILTLCSLIIILDSLKFWLTLMEFIFAGIIPWTNVRISPAFMLIVISILGGVLVGRIVIYPIIHKLDIPKIKKVTTKIKNRQPKNA